MCNRDIIDEKELIKKIEYEGVKILDNFDSYYLTSKHISRHIKLCRFMASKGLEMNSEVLNRLYRIDIVCCQELLKVLIPIELKITTRLLYLMEFYNIDINDFWNNEIWSDGSGLTKREKKHWSGNLKFAKEVITKVQNKWNHNNIIDLVESLTFGQTAALVMVLKNSHAFFALEINDKKLISKINALVDIRNHIAHLGMLFTNEPIRISPHRSIRIGGIISDIDSLANGDFISDFKLNIDSYETRTVNKIKSEDLQGSVSKIFQEIKSVLNIV